MNTQTHLSECAMDEKQLCRYKDLCKHRQSAQQLLPNKQEVLFWIRLQFSAIFFQMVSVWKVQTVPQWLYWKSNFMLENELWVYLVKTDREREQSRRKGEINRRNSLKGMKTWRLEFYPDSLSLQSWLYSLGAGCNKWRRLQNSFRGWKLEAVLKATVEHAIIIFFNY